MARISPAYDPQREELYRMEKKGLPGLALAKYSRDNHRILLNRLCTEFGLDPPILTFEARDDCAGLYQSCAELKWAKITLSTAYKSGNSPLTLVHEIAHHVVDSWDPEGHLHPHGPEFVGVYGDALAMAGIVPWEGFRAMCARYKVECMDTVLASSPTKLRKLIKKRAAEAAQVAHPHKKAIRLAANLR